MKLVTFELNMTISTIMSAVFNLYRSRIICRSAESNYYKDVNCRVVNVNSNVNLLFNVSSIDN